MIATRPFEAAISAQALKNGWPRSAPDTVLKRINTGAGAAALARTVDVHLQIAVGLVAQDGERRRRRCRVVELPFLGAGDHADDEDGGKGGERSGHPRILCADWIAIQPRVPAGGADVTNRPARTTSGPSDDSGVECDSGVRSNSRVAASGRLRSRSGAGVVEHRRLHADRQPEVVDRRAGERAGYRHHAARMGADAGDDVARAGDVAERGIEARASRASAGRPRPRRASTRPPPSRRGRAGSRWRSAPRRRARAPLPSSASPCRGTIRSRASASAPATGRPSRCAAGSRSSRGRAGTARASRLRRRADRPASSAFSHVWTRGTSSR